MSPECRLIKHTSYNHGLLFSKTLISQCVCLYVLPFIQLLIYLFISFSVAVSTSTPVSTSSSFPNVMLLSLGTLCLNFSPLLPSVSFSIRYFPIVFSVYPSFTFSSIYFHFQIFPISHVFVNSFKTELCVLFTTYASFFPPFDYPIFLKY